MKFEEFLELKALESEEIVKHLPKGEHQILVTVDSDGKGKAEINMATSFSNDDMALVPLLLLQCGHSELQQEFEDFKDSEEVVDAEEVSLEEMMCTSFVALLLEMQDEITEGIKGVLEDDKEIPVFHVYRPFEDEEQVREILNGDFYIRPDQWDDLVGAPFQGLVTDLYKASIRGDLNEIKEVGTEIQARGGFEAFYDRLRENTMVILGKCVGVSVQRKS